MKMTLHQFTFYLFVIVILFGLAFSIGCAGDDDDDDDDAASDDDDDDNDTADDDTDDDDLVDPVPTTLDVTLIPVEDSGSPDGWSLGEGPGEPHIVLNDLGALPTKEAKAAPLSITYFMTLSDLHQTDEESPTRLSFFDSSRVFFGAFDAAYRPQEDVTPHLLNALTRTANQIQVDYGRDFDFAMILGDATDNAQANEMKCMIDVLDASGLTSGIKGYVRPDSGDIDLDYDSGLNLGERDFGIQEFSAEGENIDAFERPGYPHSNADFWTEGLLKSDGSPLPWYITIGNHDVLNTGNFIPNSLLTFFDEEDYVADIAHFGFIPGVASALKYLEDHPGQELRIDGGILGFDLNWRTVANLIKLAGLVDDDYELDIDSRFDLMTLLNDTPADGSDDGVYIAGDEKRAYMGRKGVMRLANKNHHGFVDRNQDGVLNAEDGGWYRLDWPSMGGAGNMPLRFLVLDSTDVPILEGGGISQEQFDWIQAQLDQAETDGVLVIVASHHYSHAIDQGGERLVEMLKSCPNVILHLVGHGHDNKVEAHLPDNTDPLYGYWEVETPSCVEYPQQGRLIEIVDNRDGTGTIYMTNFDHWPLYHDDSDDLSELGRELAFEDKMRFGYDGSGVFGGSGEVEDRNVALVFAIPEDVSEKLSSIQSDGEITSTDVLGSKL